MTPQGAAKKADYLWTDLRFYRLATREALMGGPTAAAHPMFEGRTTNELKPKSGVVRRIA